MQTMSRYRNIFFSNNFASSEWDLPLFGANRMMPSGNTVASSSSPFHLKGPSLAKKDATSTASSFPPLLGSLLLERLAFPTNSSAVYIFPPPKFREGNRCAPPPPPASFKWARAEPTLAAGLSSTQRKGLSKIYFFLFSKYIRAFGTIWRHATIIIVSHSLRFPPPFIVTGRCYFFLFVRRTVIAAISYTFFWVFDSYCLYVWYRFAPLWLFTKGVLLLLYS